MIRGDNILQNTLYRSQPDSTAMAEEPTLEGMAAMTQLSNVLDGYTVGMTIVDETLKVAEQVGGEAMSQEIQAGIKQGFGISTAVYMQLEVRSPGAVKTIRDNIGHSLQAQYETLKANESKGFWERLLGPRT